MSINCFFVYGTLQQGESRQDCWPREPRRILRATVKGRLYDLGRYPALVEGEDCVAGELWVFDAGDVPTTLNVIDAIEGYSRQSDDLYKRTVVDCACSDGQTRRAHTYLFTDVGSLDEAARLPADSEGLVTWSQR